jgi:hypothetical protein
MIAAKIECEDLWQIGSGYDSLKASAVPGAVCERLGLDANPPPVFKIVPEKARRPPILEGSL